MVAWGDPELEIIDLVTHGYDRRDALGRAAGVIGAHKVCLVATDTTYALAASAESRLALGHLESLKDRPASEPFSIIVASVQMAKRYARLTRREVGLMGRLLPGGVTVLVPARPGLDPRIVAEGKVGIRIPARSFVRDLSRLCAVALTATSANLRGLPPAFSVAEFASQLRSSTLAGLVGGLVDEGVLPATKVSTIVDITTDTLRIVREGCVPAARIADILKGG